MQSEFIEMKNMEFEITSKQLIVSAFHIFRHAFIFFWEVKTTQILGCNYLPDSLSVGCQKGC